MKFSNLAGVLALIGVILLSYFYITGNQEKIIIPKNAVISFNELHCPQGWKEYEPAYGRFVRGIDKSGTSIDPEGQRAVGTLQKDSIRKHEHLAAAAGNIKNGSDGSGERVAPPSEPTATDMVNPGAETRPKNVALLYCEKL